MSSFLTRIFGTSPIRTLIRLLIISAIVGFIFYDLGGWKPLDVPEKIWHFIVDVTHWGVSSFGELFEMLLVGAMIVIPIFVVRRLLKRKEES